MTFGVQRWPFNRSPFNRSTVRRSTVQPFNRSTVQPFNRSTVQPFNRSPFALQPFVQRHLACGVWRGTPLCFLRSKPRRFAYSLGFPLPFVRRTVNAERRTVNGDGERSFPPPLFTLTGGSLGWLSRLVPRNRREISCLRTESLKI
jgi:hypothetical protein